MEDALRISFGMFGVIWLKLSSVASRRFQRNHFHRPKLMLPAFIYKIVTINAIILIAYTIRTSLNLYIFTNMRLATTSSIHPLTDRNIKTYFVKCIFFLTFEIDIKYSGASSNLYPLAAQRKNHPAHTHTHTH